MGSPLTRQLRRAAAAAAVVAAAAGLAACGGGGTTTVTTAVAPPQPPPATAPQVSGTEATSIPGPSTTPVDTTATTPVDTTTTPPADTTATAPVDTTAVDTSGTTPLVDRPSDFPTEEEAALLAALPSQVAARCTRESQDDIADEAVAGLDCDTQDALGARAYYELFASNADMYAVYRRFRTDNDVALESGPCVAEGGSTPGELPQENSYSDLNDDDLGRVMCFESDAGNVWFISTRDSLNAMTYVVSPSRADSAAFWSRVGILGP